MLLPEDELLKNILLSENMIKEDQLAELEEEYSRTKRPFQDILVDYEITTKDQLLEIIAGHLNTMVIRLSDFKIEDKYIALLTSEQARNYAVVPFGIDEDGSIKIASKNPLDAKLADDLRFILGKGVKIYVTKDSQIETALERYYPSVTISELLSGMNVDLLKGEEEWTEDKIESLASETPIIRFVDLILNLAVKEKASDIHFEPFESSFKIRYRVDGILYEMNSPNKNLAIPITSRIKIMSGLNIAERRLPQDGRIQIRLDGKLVDLRISTLPTQYGESLVLRILDRSVVNLDLDALGFPQKELEAIRKIINMPNGIFVVTGPTGSGKTTTLYSALKEINTADVKILTAEDPVEYDIEGIIQLPVNFAVGMTFARALRAFLRQDPDIIMVGEIRDLETAEMAIQASLTGHIVFSTLHTREAVDTITRLIDMGVEPYLINSSLLGVIGQRLVRCICTACKTEYIPKEKELQLLNLDKSQLVDKKFYYGKGCRLCNFTGYKGRRGIVELLRITPAMCELILKYSSTSILRNKAKEEGMVTMRENGIKSVLNGETTVEEILKYT